DSLVRYQDRRGLCPGDHHDRGPGIRWQAPSTPGGLPRRRRHAVRLLHQRHDHDRRCAATGESPAIARGDRRVHGWEYLPMRYLSPDHRRHPQGRPGGEGGPTMNEPGNITTGIEVPMEIEPERYELWEAPAYRFELDRRDFLKAMGGGLLVLYLLDRE